MRHGIGIAAALGFVATVWAANWALKRWGFVSVGFGLSAPAGVWFAGLAFTLRDVTGRQLGRRAVILAILAGGALSLIVSTRYAWASALAFLISEACDFAVYEPVRSRGWLPAVAASNVVGLTVDSALFLLLAFGSLRFIEGQLVGKAWMTLAAILLLAAWQWAHPREALA
jgi:queuosine precursor transporter